MRVSERDREGGRDSERDRRGIGGGVDGIWRECSGRWSRGDMGDRE